MTTTQDPIAHASRLLREAAEELRQAHAFPGIEGWENETDAKAAYDEHMAAAQALEDWEAAVGAGGVQALSAAPGDVLDEALRERDDAEDFIDALLDEVLGHERPEWSSSYGRADALNDVQERMTALHKPAVDKAWGRFQSAMAAPSAEQQAAPKAAPHLPERDASLPAERQGLFRKFVVGRVDGSDKPGGKHHGCTYFVLDVDHDPCARPALAAYAAACESTHPTLAADLRTKWGVVPAPQPAALSEPIDQLERKLAIIGVVGAIDGHDVVRRESVLEIARRAALAAQGGQ